MDKYFCPYCNPKYQFNKKSIKGNFICGLCGEDLVKRPFIRLNQIIAFIAVLSLILPLIYILIFLIKSQNRLPKKNYQANINFISIKQNSRNKEKLNT